jgi:septal ring factor EnvC (AmiA/AmiB activator)
MTSVTSKQNPEVDPVYLLTQLVKLEEQTKALALVVTDLKETNEGTLRTKGLKEKIAQAEMNIDTNKQSFDKVEKKLEEINKSFTITVQEAFLETTVEFNKVKVEIDKRIDALTIASETQKGILTKWQPYLNVIAWLVAGAGGVLLTQILTGRLKIVIP